MCSVYDIQTSPGLQGKQTIPILETGGMKLEKWSNVCEVEQPVKSKTISDFKSYTLSTIAGGMLQRLSWEISIPACIPSSCLYETNTEWKNYFTLSLITLRTCAVNSSPKRKVILANDFGKIRDHINIHFGGLSFKLGNKCGNAAKWFPIKVGPS